MSSMHRVVVVALLLAVLVCASAHTHKPVYRNAGAGRHNHRVNAAAASVSIDASKPTFEVSPLLWAQFFEELNHAGVGGLYSELINNPMFQSNTVSPWTTSGCKSAALTHTHPLNAVNNQSWAIDASTASASAPCILVNSGYYGIAAKDAAIYNVSFYAFVSSSSRRHSARRVSAGAAVPVTVGLQSADGKTQYAQTTVQLDGGAAWKQYSVQITTAVAAGMDGSAEFFLSISQPLTVQLQLVSVMPAKGWRNLPYIRADLADLIAAMHPGALRFPGGSYVDGLNLDDAFHWKNTVGPKEERAGHQSLWGYWNPDHLGVYELFMFSEALGAEPILVVNAGLDYSDSHQVPVDQMGPWVQEALDAIEFANGNTSSPNGAIRASMGHPEPFNLKYIAIGNENAQDNSQLPYYEARYPLFYNAIKAAYPEMNVVSNSNQVAKAGQQFDLWDLHQYDSPENLVNDIANDLTHANRSQPIFLSEYAVAGTWISGNQVNFFTHKAALAEASFMIGMEQNSDVVKIGCYAPLLVNDGNHGWDPDAIVFNSHDAYVTPSYYVQTMFGGNAGCETLPSTVSFASTLGNPTNSTLMVSATTRPQQDPNSNDAPIVCDASSDADEIVVKAVWWGNAPVTATFAITLPAGASLESTATATTMSSANMYAKNSFTAPDTVTPTTATVPLTLSTSGAVTSFSYAVPAQSVLVLVLSVSTSA